MREVWSVLAGLAGTRGDTLKRHVSPDVLRWLMGHADIATTMKYYTGKTAEDLARVREALATEFGGMNVNRMSTEPVVAQSA